MIRCILQAVSRAPASMDYTFYDADGLKLLTNRDATLSDNFDLFLREFPMIPYTLSLIDADGNERFTLRKKTGIVQTLPAFTLIFPGGIVNFIEDKTRFSLPNTSFRFGIDKFSITGSIRERQFFVESDSDPVVAIRGVPVSGGKKYTVDILSDRLPLEVCLGVALLLDIYFHNY